MIHNSTMNLKHLKIYFEQLNPQQIEAICCWKWKHYGTKKEMNLVQLFDNQRENELKNYPGVKSESSLINTVHQPEGKNGINSINQIISTGRKPQEGHREHFCHLGLLYFQAISKKWPWFSLVYKDCLEAKDQHVGWTDRSQESERSWVQRVNNVVIKEHKCIDYKFIRF